MHNLRHTLLSLLVPTAAMAQIPVGSAVNGTIGTTTTPFLMVPPVANTATPITGSALTTCNAVAIDPINSSLWYAGSTTSGPLMHGFMSGGNTIVSETAVTTIASGNSLAGITFDIDGNPVIASGTVSSTGGIFQVHRTTGAVTQLIGVASGITGIANGIDRDPATGDIYFCNFGTGGGKVYRISPPTYNTATLIGQAAGTSLSGVTFARTPAAPIGTCFVSGFASPFLQSIDVLTGTAAGIPGTPSLVSLNWVDYDPIAGQLWMNANSARFIYLSDLLGNNSTVFTVGTGVPAAVEVNAIDVNSAVLNVAPNYVPTTGAPITLEVGVAGNPGEYAVVVIVAPFVAMLGSGPVDAGGKFSVAIPGLVVAPGSPGAVRFIGATVNLSTFAVKVSNTYSWPAN